MVNIGEFEVTLPIKDVLRLYDTIRGYPELVCDVDILIENFRRFTAEKKSLLRRVAELERIIKAMETRLETQSLLR